MLKTDFNRQRKVFGGTNFLVVLWALLTIFRIVINLTKSPEQVLGQGVAIFIIPLLFMAVLNLFLGITLFFPQKKNTMWILSVLVVAATLITLNFFQARIEKVEAKHEFDYKVIEDY